MDANDHSRRLQARFDWAIILIFVLFVSIPVATMFLPRAGSTDVSLAEQRTAAPFPKLALDLNLLRAFPGRFDAFIDENFGFRQRLIRWNSLLYARLLNMSVSPKVVVGKDNWLFYNGDSATGDASPIRDSCGIDPLAFHELEHLRWVYQDQHDWLAQHGIPYLLVLVPSKPGLYSEFLPDRYPPSGQPGWREQLLEYLRAKTRVPAIDVTLALREEKPRERVFLRTDTHWNAYGAFLAHREIIRALNRWFPDLEPIHESEYSLSRQEAPGGDLAEMLNLPDVLCEDWIRLDPRFAARATRSARGDGAMANIVGGSGDSGQPTAYVYRDSFTDELLPFLTGYFSEIEYEFGQHGSKMKNIERRKPDVVMQIMADRILKVPIICAPRIQRFGSEQRFNAASQEIATYTPETGFAGLVPEGSLKVDLHPGGLIVEAPKGNARLVLPSIPDTDEILLVIRFDIRSPETSFVQVFGVKAPRRPWHASEETGLGREMLGRGRNVIHVSITDPRPVDHLVVELGPAPGKYIVHGMEIRAVPR